MFESHSGLPVDPMLQRYRDYARQRQMTLGDLLLENRIVFLAGVINDACSAIRAVAVPIILYDFMNTCRSPHYGFWPPWSQGADYGFSDAT